MWLDREALENAKIKPKTLVIYCLSYQPVSLPSKGFNIKLDAGG